MLTSELLQRKFGSKVFEVVAISPDDEKNFLGEIPGPLTYAKFAEPGDSLPETIPLLECTWLIDPDGKVVSQLTGLPLSEVEDIVGGAVRLAKEEEEKQLAVEKEARRKQREQDTKKMEIAKKSISFSVSQIGDTKMKKRSEFIGQTIAIIVQSSTDFKPMDVTSEIESVEITDLFKMDNQSDETQSTYFATLQPKFDIPLGKLQGQLIFKFSDGELEITKELPMRFHFTSPD